MATLLREEVTAVHHWTDRLFSFRTTRNRGFRFKNGHFTMIGLEQRGKPLMGAYSMASANYEDELEFFSIKVPDGPLTSARAMNCWSTARPQAPWCRTTCCPGKTCTS